MWYLEHFSTVGIDPDPINRKSTFCSIHNNGHVVPDITGRSVHHFDSRALLSHVQIPEKLQITALYGTPGISWQDIQSESRENVVLEMPAHWLDMISDHQLRYLVNNFNMLLTDFEDGAMFANNQVCRRLIGLRQTPRKRIIYATSSTLINHKPELNLYHVHVPYWLFYTGSVSYETYKDNLQQCLDIILSSEYPRQVLFLNLKPRLYRLKALLQLFKRGLLDNPMLEWSLAETIYKITGRGVQQDTATELIQSDEVRGDAINKLTTEEQALHQKFSTAYKFPRLYSPMDNLTQILQSASTDFAKFNWNFAVETHFGDEFPLMYKLGRASFLTEKTYKSFSQGSMPITLCDGAPYDYLNKLGFLVDNQYLDCYNDPEELLTNTIELIDNILTQGLVPDRNHIAHNFQLITDIKHTASVYSQSLINIVESLTHSK